MTHSYLTNHSLSLPVQSGVSREERETRDILNDVVIVNNTHKSSEKEKKRIIEKREKIEFFEISIKWSINHGAHQIGPCH